MSNESHPPKFLADENVGKLCKWLRILGYDVAYYSPISDSELVRRALREDRTILTRDSRLIERKLAKKFLLLTSNDPMKQLVEVLSEFKLRPSQVQFLSRCIECNVPISPVEKSEVLNFVPPYVYETHDNFYRCPKCRKVYWAGSHVLDVLDRLGKKLGKGT